VTLLATWGIVYAIATHYTEQVDRCTEAQTTVGIKTQAMKERESGVTDKHARNIELPQELGEGDMSLSGASRR